MPLKVKLRKYTLSFAPESRREIRRGYNTKNNPLGQIGPAKSEDPETRLIQRRSDWALNVPYPLFGDIRRNAHFGLFFVYFPLALSFSFSQARSSFQLLSRQRKHVCLGEGARKGRKEALTVAPKSDRGGHNRPVLSRGSGGGFG